MDQATGYQDRQEAGRVLAEKLTDRSDLSDALVLALPRGGVPVAYEVAAALGVPMDLLIVRKLGYPGHEELAIGAIASGGGKVIDEDMIRDASISDEQLDSIIRKQRDELARREAAYRGDRPQPEVTGRVVVLIDDGLATGSTMQAAVQATKQRNPARLIVAVPVAPPMIAMQLQQQVDELICPLTPRQFHAVGQWYQQFDQTTDDEVRDLLQRAWQRQADGTKHG